MQHDLELSSSEGFGQKHHSAGGEAVLREFWILLSCHHHYRNIRKSLLRFHLPDEFRSRDVRHHDVENRSSEIWIVLQNLVSLAPIARGDATVAIIKVRAGKVTQLASARVDSVMAGAVDTRLSVECMGERLKLSARGSAGLSARDSDLRAGRAGLVVAGEKLAGTSASFDNFELSDLSP